MIETGAAAVSAIDDHGFAVVIPAYNEEKTISDVARGALLATPHVVVVDDGSTDGTAAAVADLPVRLIRLEINRGKAAALQRGFAFAESLGIRGVVTLDGDGQHRPEDIKRIAAAGLASGEHIIIGSRLGDPDKFPKARLRANRIASFWISWAAGHPIEDSQSGFRFYPAKVLHRLAERDKLSSGFTFESEVLILAARHGVLTKAIAIPALYDGVMHRASHFRPVRDITHIVLMVAWKLISRGMYPMGLYRSLVRPAERGLQAATAAKE